MAVPHDVDGEKGPPRVRQGRSRQALAVILGLLAGLVAGLGLAWAGTTVLAPPAEELASEQLTTVAVEQGEVGSSINLNTAVHWTTDPIGLNGASGVVTSVDVTAGESVGQGGRLYTVNMRPVVVGVGAVPAYQSMQVGSTGPDVAQLQQLLTGLGYYSGAVDGEFGDGTGLAVRAWQKDAGFPVDGVVRQSDIVWVPALPAPIQLDAEVFVVGQQVSAGTGDIFALGVAPEFEIPMQAAQARLAPTGTSVLVSAPDGTVWPAIVSSVEQDEQSSDVLHAYLTAPDGSAVCAASCGVLPVEGEVLLPSEIVTVAAVEGLVVPASAILTDASGQAWVRTPDGEDVPVTVVASARGMAVIEGVDEGDLVLVPVEQA